MTLSLTGTRRQHINKRLQWKINFRANSLKMPHTLNDSHFLSFKLLKPCCPWHLRPPSTAASSLPSRPAFLHPSFALLLSPDGNYLHKSVFALWFAPSHKWRLSLFNHGGFVGHVKAYNVAGPCFLHTTVTDLSLLERGELVLVRGGPSKVTALRVWGGLCTGSGFRLIYLPGSG